MVLHLGFRKGMMKMQCPECQSIEIYMEDEYYDRKVHILTMKCHDCCALFEEHYVFEQTVVLTKGNK